MSWVGYLLKDSELFILFAENSQILLKISVIPILLTFIYLVALNLSVSSSKQRDTDFLNNNFDISFLVVLWSTGTCGSRTEVSLTSTLLVSPKLYLPLPFHIIALSLTKIELNNQLNSLSNSTHHCGT